MSNQVHNLFSQSKPNEAPLDESALVEIEGQRAIQEVQAAMVIAQKFPRDQIKSMDRVIQACTRPTLAEGALYSYNRGGADVTGPSIRLAEAIAQSWGNIQFGIREISQHNSESTVESFAWDLEANTRQSKLFHVPHIRFTRTEGRKELTDPRDIYEAVANQGSRRLRACILGVIPGDVTESAVQQCEKTLNQTANTSQENIKAMLTAFQDHFGVTQNMIETRLGCRMDSIRAAQMVQLKKVYQSLRDGMSSTGNWFVSDEKASKTRSFADISGQKHSARTQAHESGATQTPQAEQPTQEQPPEQTPQDDAFGLE